MDLTHDMKMTKATLQSIVVYDLNNNQIKPHMCMDKGYAFPEVYNLWKSMAIQFT